MHMHQNDEEERTKRNRRKSIVQSERLTGQKILVGFAEQSIFENFLLETSP